MRIFTIIFLFFALNHTDAQTLRGKVTDVETGKPLFPVIVLNLRDRESVTTDNQGNYSMPVLPGDLIAYSYVGYRPQQRQLANVTYNLEENVAMEPLNYKLKEVTVRTGYGKYQADSAERRDVYQRPLARTHANPIGSPFSALAELFNKNSKSIKNFQKNYNKWESQLFIDTRYTPELVTRLTGMVGDSVGMFMNTHPMPFDYARTASDLELKMWIRYAYRAWIGKTGYPRDSINKK